MSNVKQRALDALDGMGQIVFNEMNVRDLSTRLIVYLSTLIALCFDLIEVVGNYQRQKDVSKYSLTLSKP